MLYFELISVSGASADQAQRRFFVKRLFAAMAVLLLILAALFSCAEPEMILRRG